MLNPILLQVIAYVAIAGFVAAALIGAWIVIILISCVGGAIWGSVITWVKMKRPVHRVRVVGARMVRRVRRRNPAVIPQCADVEMQQAPPVSDKYNA